MVKRPHSTMAAIAALIATLAVLMPWCAVTVSMGAAGSKLYTHNGFACGFQGAPIMVLCGLGAIFALLVAAIPAATLPVRPRYLLFMAACPLLAAFVLTFMDYLREGGTCELESYGTILEAGRGMGIHLTLIFSGGAGLCALWDAWTSAAPELPAEETVEE